MIRSWCLPLGAGLTLMMASLGTFPALLLNVLIGLLGIAAFLAIALSRQRGRDVLPSEGRGSGLGTEVA